MALNSNYKIFDKNLITPRTGDIINSNEEIKNEADLLTDIYMALQNSLEFNADTGTATGGSNTTLVDTAKSWETDIWANATISIEISGISYIAKVISNTSDTITFSSLAGGATVVSGNLYQIKTPISNVNLTKVGGVAQTAADWTNYFKNITKTGNITGTATGGSNTTLTDTNLAVDVNALSLAYITFVISGKTYITKILSNSADTITFTDIGTSVIAGTEYTIIYDFKRFLTSIKDTDSSITEAMSSTIDPNLVPVQRIVDAAPFAYNSGEDSINYVNKDIVTDMQIGQQIITSGDVNKMFKIDVPYNTKLFEIIPNNPTTESKYYYNVTGVVGDPPQSDSIPLLRSQRFSSPDSGRFRNFSFYIATEVEETFSFIFWI